jgi:hypothetical protein
MRFSLDQGSLADRAGKEIFQAGKLEIVRPCSVTHERDKATLIAQMQKSIAEANAFIKAMVPPPH